MSLFGFFSKKKESESRIRVGDENQKWLMTVRETLSELPPHVADPFKSKYDRLIEDLNSSNSKDRLSSLGVLITCMWSRNPWEKVVAAKIVASVLKSSDPDMVHKAASGLTELGGIGIRYCEMAAIDPQTEGARLAIVTKAMLAESARPTRDLTRENFAEEARAIVEEAIEEARYHSFSSLYRGGFPSHENISHKYVFEINFSYDEEGQALTSFTRKDGAKVKDRDCVPILEAFAQGVQYHEDLDLPRNSEIRYFRWGLMSILKKMGYDVIKF